MSTSATRKKYERWQPEEEQALLAKYQDENVTQIAEYLGKPPKLITDKLTYLRRKGVIPASSKLLEHNTYTTEELELLSILVGTMPLPKLHKLWNKKAKKNGWPLRTIRSLEMRIHRLGESLVPEVGYFSAAALALGLGCSPTLVKAWITSKKLKAEKDSEKASIPWRIKDKDFVRFALDYPEDVAERVSIEGMAWLLCLIKDVCGTRL